MIETFKAFTKLIQPNLLYIFHDHHAPKIFWNKFQRVTFWKHFISISTLKQTKLLRQAKNQRHTKTLVQKCPEKLITWCMEIIRLQKLISWSFFSFQKHFFASHLDSCFWLRISSNNWHILNVQHRLNNYLFQMSINFSCAKKISKLSEFNFTGSSNCNIFCGCLLQDLCPLRVSARLVSSFRSAYLISSVLILITTLTSNKTFWCIIRMYYKQIQNKQKVWKTK